MLSAITEVREVAQYPHSRESGFQVKRFLACAIVLGIISELWGRGRGLVARCCLVDNFVVTKILSNRLVAFKTAIMHDMSAAVVSVVVGLLGILLNLCIF